MWRGHIRIIQDIVCGVFRISRMDMLSSRRDESVIPARHIAMMMSRNLTGASFTEIGKQFRRDHSTIIDAVRNAEKLIEKNATIKTMAEKCIMDFNFYTKREQDDVHSESQKD